MWFISRVAWQRSREDCVRWFRTSAGRGHCERVFFQRALRTASRMRLAASVGWEIRDAWLDGTVFTVARIRCAMKRCRSGFIRRSWVDTRNQEGFDFQAGEVIGTPKQFFFDAGFWTAARMRA